MPYDEVLEDGIIISKNDFIKILKIFPISYNLKSDFEKNAILDGYKLFLRSCNFDIQILIQSKKENINEIINSISFDNIDEIDNIKKEYILYIKNLNSSKKLLSKNFFILIKIPKEDNFEINKVREELNDRFFKIKETLSKCGNEIFELNSKEEVVELIFSFLNPYEQRR